MNTKAKHEMTKLNRTNDATITRNGGARVRNTTRTTNEPVASIPLKSLHNDILRDVPTFARTTKQMRVELRAKFADIHDKNASWTFTSRDYDRVRSHFDPKYAAKIARAARPKKVRAKKDATPAPVAADPNA